MSIFESLENLNVSEECFDEIMGIVEELLGEGTNNWEPAKYKNKWSVYDKTSCVYYPTKGGRKGAEKRCKELNTEYPDKPQVDPFYESLMEEIMGIVEELLGEGREPFETQQDYKQRLQKHFGPKLNDKLATQKSIAKHYDKKAKGLNKEVKKAEAERVDADKKEAKAQEKWDNAWKVSKAIGDTYGYDSDLYRETKDGKDKASKKLDNAQASLKKAWKKLDNIKDKKYDAENSADIARGEQDKVSHKIWKTGTSYYRH